MPPSFGIVSRDCYDANLLAALRKAQARAEAAEDDALRLHREKMVFFDRAIAAEAQVRELEERLKATRDLLWSDLT